MKRLIRKGFSMVELLFVMVILAALAAIAIPNMSSGTDSANRTAMRSDLTNTLNLIENKRIVFDSYSAAFGESGNSTINVYLEDADNDGFADTTLADGTKIPLSKGVSLSLNLNDSNEGLVCSAGAVHDNTIIAYHNETPGMIIYHPCTLSTIKTVPVKGLLIFGDSGKVTIVTKNGNSTEY